MYDYDVILRVLEKQVLADFQHQVLDPDRADFGAVIPHSYGMPVADHTSGGLSLARMGYALLLDRSTLRSDEALLKRTRASAEFISRWQRPTGLIDLPKVDFDSPPDTAFLLQLLCPVLALARERANQGDDAGRELVRALETIVVPAAGGIVGRGFRTPNHRWVVCSALAQAMSLFPDLQARPYIEQILAETIDINSDGEYSERSTGIYSAVCNRALRLLADHLDLPRFLDPVRANLRFMAALLNPDGSVETAISRRQDQGTQAVPMTMADSYFDLAVRDRNAEWATIADRLAAACVNGVAGDCETTVFWILHTLVQNPESRNARLARITPDNEGEQLFAASKLWRSRHGATSATAAAETPVAFSVRQGDVSLRAMRVRGTYFHVASFEADKIEQLNSPGSIRLSHLASRRSSPGWDLPLGRPVVYDNPHRGYYQLADEGTRQRWTLNPLDIFIDLHRVHGGYDLVVSTRGGYDRIPFIVEFLFATGGTLRTGELAFKPCNEQAIILRGGGLVYHTRTHGISISPGSDAHAMLTEIPSPRMAGCFRVVLPLLAPLNQKIAVRCGLWSDATRSLMTEECSPPASARVQTSERASVSA